MGTEKYTQYIIKTIDLLKNKAIEAKIEANNPKEGLRDYAEGILMGYYSIISLLKHQAFTFCLDQKKLGLSDIKPDIDLLNLRRNPDIEFEEDNWTVDPLNEEKIKGYLSDSIKLLKEQALEIKKNAGTSKKESRDYNNGEITAYYRAIELIKNQTEIFGIDAGELGLSSMDPEVDLLGLEHNPKL